MAVEAETNLNIHAGLPAGSRRGGVKTGHENEQERLIRNMPFFPQPVATICVIIVTNKLSPVGCLSVKRSGF